MKQLLLFCGWMAYSLIGYAQSNILVTNDEADSILKGLYNPADYIPDNVINSPFDIVDGIISGISPDSLKSHLEVLSTFGNRNTGADTISTTKGMGAARRWAFAKFQAFSENAENRLIPSYLQFDEEVCGMERHRNTFSILPGVGPQFDEVIIISGHLDSRCTDPCDITCEAVGMEDNGSGSVLVLELARVLSSFTFNRTIVFLLTTGEEQGLFGATAFAEYCEQQGIKVAAVLNNDTVGGIICGATASPPGCPGLGAIDSTNIRIYSAGTNTSPHKGLARFIKLEYEENVLPFVPTPNVINIMTSEDRVGRGGDHIPFRQRGFSAVRFTTAHEHGDGNPSQDGYTDRQHTINDVLGLDTDNDGVLDSFFVDFNYLARNTIINANAAAMAALGPITPLDVEFEDVDTGIQFAIDDPNDYGTYRIGWYGFNQNEFDTLITVNTISDTIVGLPSGPYFISVAAVDSNGIESLFTIPQLVLFTLTGTEELTFEERPITLLQNTPNPFDNATVIGVEVHRNISYTTAELVVRNMLGQDIAHLPISLQEGINKVTYDYQHHNYQPGAYIYSLYIDGKLYESKQMIYAY